MKVILLLLIVCLQASVLVTGNRVVCYFINWAWYRDQPGKFVPQDLDPSLCTHINYAFAILDPNTLTLKSSDPWADIDNRFYSLINGLKSQNPNLKVLISLGGWTDSAGDKYSRLVSDSQKRQNFIQQVIPFLKTHNFDGLDIDWEYPQCWQGNCNSGRNDKANFATWVKELRTAFDKESPRLLLTAAVVSAGEVVDQGYDVPSISKDMDFINIMTYDFHNYFDGKTGHHAQRQAKSSDGPRDFSVVGSANYWVSRGAPKNKLVIGLPAYGRSFTLANSGVNGLGASASGPGTAGEITREAGFLGYYEICTRLRQGWTRDRDDDVGPWITQGSQWIGYDEPKDAVTKARYVRDNGFGGVMVWDVTMDDFRGTCCGTKFPFLKAMNYGVFGRGEDPSTYGCP